MSGNRNDFQKMVQGKTKEEKVGLLQGWKRALPECVQKDEQGQELVKGQDITTPQGLQVIAAATQIANKRWRLEEWIDDMRKELRKPEEEVVIPARVVLPRQDFFAQSSLPLLKRSLRDSFKSRLSADILAQKEEFIKRVNVNAGNTFFIEDNLSGPKFQTIEAFRQHLKTEVFQSMSDKEKDFFSKVIANNLEACMTAGSALLRGVTSGEGEVISDGCDISVENGLVFFNEKIRFSSRDGDSATLESRFSIDSSGAIKHASIKGKSDAPVKMSQLLDEKNLTMKFIKFLEIVSLALRSTAGFVKRAVSKLALLKEKHLSFSPRRN